MFEDADSAQRSLNNSNEFSQHSNMQVGLKSKLQNESASLLQKNMNLNQESDESISPLDKFRLNSNVTADEEKMTSLPRIITETFNRSVELNTKSSATLNSSRGSEVIETRPKILHKSVRNKEHRSNLLGLMHQIQSNLQGTKNIQRGLQTKINTQRLKNEHFDSVSAIVDDLRTTDPRLMEQIFRYKIREAEDF